MEGGSAVQGGGCKAVAQRHVPPQPAHREWEGGGCRHTASAAYCAGGRRRAAAAVLRVARLLLIGVPGEDFGASYMPGGE